MLFKILCLLFIAMATATPTATKLPATVDTNCGRVGCKIRLPVRTGNYDLAFIFKYTQYLHDIHQFRTFMVFSEKRELNREKHVIVRPLEQALMEEFHTPIVVWGNDRRVHLRITVGLNSLIFVYISSVKDPILSMVSHNLEGIHYMPMIFIFKRIKFQQPSKQEIRKFFNWCWEENILNVALTYQIIRHHRQKSHITIDIHTEVFNYTPFPEMRIFNVTRAVQNNSGNFIKNNIKNVHGYRFQAPMFMDTPTVFLVSNCKSKFKGQLNLHKFFLSTDRL